MVKLSTLSLFIIISFTYAGPIEDLQPGEWYEVPNSHMEAQCPTDTEFPGIWAGNSQSCTGVMDAWSGGTFDAKRNRLWVWGGGHHRYYGNEVYAFSLETLTWARLTDPSPPTTPEVCTSVLSDGNPNSRHTYSGLCYINHADKIFTLGGAGACGNSSGQDITWTYNLDSNTWHRMADEPFSPGAEANALYWPEDGKVYFHNNSTGNRGWFRYDYDSDAWEELIRWEGYTYGHSCVIEPVRKLVVAVGTGNVKTYDITKTTMDETILTTTGDTFVVGKNNPGLAYDPVLKKIVGWSGTNDLYSLDLGTNIWTKHTPAASNTDNAPAITASGGVYGRFQYCADKNIYVCVNDVAENVFIYRLTAGSTSIQMETPSLKSQPLLRVSPNPFRALVKIQIGQAPARISIYDVNGRIMLSKKIKHSFIWNAADCPSGIYIVKLKTGNNQVFKPIFHGR